MFLHILLAQNWWSTNLINAYFKLHLTRFGRKNLKTMMMKNQAHHTLIKCIYKMMMMKTNNKTITTNNEKMWPVRLKRYALKVRCNQLIM